MPCESPEATCTGNATGDRFDSSFKSTTKLWRLCPWPLHRPYTKLTCPSPTTGERGLPRFHWRQGTVHHMRETHRSFARTLEKHKLCLSISYYNYIVITGRTDDKPTVSLCTDDNGTPAIWTLILSSSKSSTGRTGQVEGRFNYWNYMETSLQPGIQEYSTGQGLIARRRHAL